MKNSQFLSWTKSRLLDKHIPRSGAAIHPHRYRAKSAKILKVQLHSLVGGAAPQLVDTIRGISGPATLLHNAVLGEFVQAKGVPI